MIHRSGTFGDPAGVYDALVPSEPGFDQANRATLILPRLTPRREDNTVGSSWAQQQFSPGGSRPLESSRFDAFKVEIAPESRHGTASSGCWRESLNQAFSDPAEDSGVCVLLKLEFDEANQAATAFHLTSAMSSEAILRGKARASIVDWGDWSKDKGWLQSEPVQGQGAENAATWVRTWRVVPGRINAWPLERPEPSLAERARGTLNELTALSVGWDGYDGLPTFARVAEHTQLFLKEVEAYTSSAPDLVPLPNGGVQLEWYIGEVEIEVEIEPDGATTILFECRSDGRSEEIELGGSLDLSPVADFFRELPP